MSSAEKMSVRRMLLLTLPTLGFSTALSLVTTYLPPILDMYTDSATLIGFAIGGEGIFSSLIPLWVGVMSDRIWTKRWGRRQPFMIFAAPFMAASLMLAPFQPGFVPIAVSTFVFFAAYHFYTAPYQALLPDVTPAGHHGKVQGYQAAMRGVGMFLGMVVAGLLFYRWKPSPFIICGLLILIFTYFTVVRVKEPEPDRSLIPPRQGIWGELKRIAASTWADKRIRQFMVAAFLWESTLAGIRPFVVLYFKKALGATEQTGALLLGLVGVTYVVAGLVGGYLSDKYGRSRIMMVGLWVYLGGCFLGVFMNDIKWAFIFLPIFGLGGSIVLTLPYAILIRLMPKAHVGQYTGMFSMVRGLSNIIAPLLSGAAIDVAGHWLAGTSWEGREYSSIWAVAALMIIISLFFFRGSKRDELANV
ncbi:MAG: MFS transporter [Thermoleophilia bacterium]|nr:MFS transporter [Thermoleophilia bacterium]